MISDALLEAVIKVLIAVFVPVITGFLSVLLNKWISKMKLQLTEAQLAFAAEMVDRYIAAAEQYNLAELLKQEGKEKKQWVIEKVDALLQTYGIDIDEVLIADLIEEAVFNHWEIGKKEKKDALGFKEPEG